MSGRPGGWARIVPAMALVAIVTTSVMVVAGCSEGMAGPSPTSTFPAVPPAWPFVFSGNATAGGDPVPAGLTIIGRIGDYRSATVTTTAGHYQSLPVGPLDPQFFDREITFELSRGDGKTVVAGQTVVFRALDRPTVYDFDLTFPAFE